MEINWSYGLGTQSTAMLVLIAQGKLPHIIAYCLNSRDAELLKALHVYYGANFTEVVNKLVAEAE